MMRKLSCMYHLILLHGTLGQFSLSLSHLVKITFKVSKVKSSNQNNIEVIDF